MDDDGLSSPNNAHVSTPPAVPGPSSLIFPVHQPQPLSSAPQSQQEQLTGAKPKIPEIEKELEFLWTRVHNAALTIAVTLHGEDWSQVSSVLTNLDKFAKKGMFSPQSCAFQYKKILATVGSTTPIKLNETPLEISRRVLVEQCRRMTTENILINPEEEVDYLYEMLNIQRLESDEEIKNGEINQIALDTMYDDEGVDSDSESTVRMRKLRLNIMSASQSNGGDLDLSLTASEYETESDDDLDMEDLPEPRATNENLNADHSYSIEIEDDFHFIPDELPVLQPDDVGTVLRDLQTDHNHGSKNEVHEPDPESKYFDNLSDRVRDNEDTNDIIPESLEPISLPANNILVPDDILPSFHGPQEIKTSGDDPEISRVEVLARNNMMLEQNEEDILSKESTKNTSTIQNEVEVEKQHSGIVGAVNDAKPSDETSSSLPHKVEEESDKIESVNEVSRPKIIDQKSRLNNIQGKELYVKLVDFKKSPTRQPSDIKSILLENNDEEAAAETGRDSDISESKAPKETKSRSIQKTVEGAGTQTKSVNKIKTIALPEMSSDCDATLPETNKKEQSLGVGQDKKKISASASVIKTREVVVNEEKVKRPVGRPKKSSIPTESTNAAILSPVEVKKRPIGRPRKSSPCPIDTESMSTVAEVKRPIGRLRKSITPTKSNNTNIHEVDGPLIRPNGTPSLTTTDTELTNTIISTPTDDGTTLSEKIEMVQKPGSLERRKGEVNSSTDESTGNELDPDVPVPISSPAAPETPTSSQKAGQEHRVRDHVFRRQINLVHDRITAHRNANIFRQPVKESNAPGYSVAVKRPLDMKTIKRLIESGSIRDIHEYECEMGLMFLNAIVYNPGSHEVHDRARDMALDSWKIIDEYKYTKQLVIAKQEIESSPRKDTPDDTLRISGEAEISSPWKVEKKLVVQITDLKSPNKQKKDESPPISIPSQKRTIAFKRKLSFEDVQKSKEPAINESVIIEPRGAQVESNNLEDSSKEEMKRMKLNEESTKSNNPKSKSKKK